MTFASSNVPPASPLAYTGQVVVPYIVETFDPVDANNQFNVPTIWDNKSTGDAFILTRKPGGVADWERFTFEDEAVFEIAADSGSALPVDNVILLSGGTTGLTTIGSGNEVDLTGILNVINGGTGQNSFTLRSVLIGNGSNALNSVNVSIGTGIPLVSNGLSVNPSFSTASVQGGGTGKTSFTSYAVICGGTTSTGVLQNVSGVGTSGQVLTSSGAAALPVWAASGAIKSVNIQTFTTSGTFTYTPTTNMVRCLIQMVGAGGGGGSTHDGVPGTAGTSAGAGGGAGEYAFGIFTAAQIGASQSVTVGAKGAGGIAPNVGSTGGTTSVGALISTLGGLGGAAGATGTATAQTGGSGGTGGTGGSFRSNGQPGGSSFSCVTTGFSSMAGNGADSFFGGGGIAQGMFDPDSTAGAGYTTVGGSGVGFGSGGAGATTGSSIGTTNVASNGGAGADGCIIITEFIG